MVRRLFLSLYIVIGMLSASLQAQDATTDGGEAASDATSREATGGAQTLEDILRRQRGEPVDDTFRREAIGNPDVAAPRQHRSARSAERPIPNCGAPCATAKPT